jgi:DNA-binding transcriptional ArsR family regulator
MKNNCCEKDSNKAEDLLSLREFLRTISDTNRLRILCLLTKKELCVCEIFEALNLSQNLVSHHLKKLEELALVEKRKIGKSIICSINQKNLRQYRELLDQIVGDCKK